MRKVILGTLLVLITLVGCTKKERRSQDFSRWMHETDRVKVLSTTAMISDLVQQVGGEQVASLCLMIGDVDPHSYELVKGDDEKIAAADLIFYNGLGLEHGASVRYHLEQSEKAVAVGDWVFKEFPDRFIMIDEQLDPHIWMDMNLFSEVIDPIVETLAQKDPAHKHLFAQRGSKLKNRLQDTDAKFRQMMAMIPSERRYLVTSHDAFQYFTKRYLALENEKTWKERVQAPEGLAPDSQISFFEIQRVCDFLCHNQVSTVFPETNVSSDALRKIVNVCQAKGTEVAVAKDPLYGDTMTGVATYEEMIEHNIKMLMHYLKEAENE